MLNVIHFSFVPNTASTQRLISYLVNIPKDIKCRLFFIMPDAKKSVWHDCPDNIEVIYCWRKFPTNYKALRYITYYLSLSYIKRQLKKGDIFVIPPEIPHNCYVTESLEKMRIFHLYFEA